MYSINVGRVDPEFGKSVLLLMAEKLPPKLGGGEVLFWAKKRYPVGLRGPMRPAFQHKTRMYSINVGRIDRGFGQSVPLLMAEKLPPKLGGWEVLIIVAGR
jgi:hypothetical protein